MIPKKMHKDRLEHFTVRCRERNFRLTPQKLEIFSLLAETADHPTAERIFIEIQKKFPTISFATVYRNLKQFVDLGLAQEIDIGDGASHFDANMEDHDHIIHTDTKEIRDICLPRKRSLLPQFEKDLEVQKVSVNIFVSKK